MPSRSADLLLVTADQDLIGSGHQLQLAAAALQAAGWQVAVALLRRGGGLADRLAAEGLPVFQVGVRPTVDAASLPRLVQLCREQRPTAVLAWGRPAAVPVAAARLVMQQLRLGQWRHLQRLAQPPRPGLELAAVGIADRVLVTADWVSAGWGAAGDAGRVVVVPPAAARFPVTVGRDQLADRLGLDPGKRWTLCVAPLAAASRLDRLLWAFDQMGVARRDLEHIIVGAGPLKRRLARRARIEELAGCVHFFDHLDCLAELLPQVDLVMQSGRVAHGGCLLEGLSHGIPLVAVDTPESREVIGDDEAGRVVPAVPESELARRAIQLLEEPDLAASCSAAASRRLGDLFDPAASLAALITAVGEAG